MTLREEKNGNFCRAAENFFKTTEYILSFTQKRYIILFGKADNFFFATADKIRIKRGI